MVTCMIDAFEKRDVTTVEIPGAFVQTKVPKNKDNIHSILDGRVSELLAENALETYQ